jgi:hypothetical protein
MSLQLQPKVPFALAGERWPLAACPFPFSITGSSGIVDGFGVALAVTFRILIGLRLLDLALRKSPFTSPSSSISSSSSSSIAAFFFADLVTGPKYPSCELSRDSEGVGEGEMTLGVAGIGFEDRDMVKGGKEGMRIAPVKSRPISATLRSKEVEWRCLSFREARIVVTEGNGDEEAVSSSGGDGAEQNCAASLKKVMMALSVPLEWHTELLV